MCSRELAQPYSSKLSFVTEEDVQLETEGLTRDPLCLPLFSLYDLFETLLKHKRTSRDTIKRKLLALHDYLVTGRLRGAPSSLKTIVEGEDSGLREELLSDTAFFSASVVALFSYAYGVRLQLFYVGRAGALSCQYFGLKQKTTKRVFMSHGSFCVLKKVLTKTNTLSTRIPSDAECANLGSNGRLRAQQEHWNKNAYKSECIYKLKSSTLQSNQVRRIDEELDSFDSADECADMLNGDYAGIRDVLSSLEHSRESDKERRIPTFTDMSHVEPTLVTIDTERFLDDWAKDITQDAEAENASCPAPAKTSTVIAGITHTNVDGMLKFYSEVKEYGFIITSDEMEIFVHKADLVKQGIDTRSLAYYRKFYNIAVKFDIEEYQGKTNKHRKAINMVILSMTPICS